MISNMSKDEKKYYLAEEWRTFYLFGEKVKEELYKQSSFKSLKQAKKYSKESIFKTKIYLIKSKLLETKNDPLTNKGKQPMD